MKFTIKCSNIRWAVEDEDVIDCISKEDESKMTDEEYAARLNEEIAKIKAELPTEVELDVWGDSDDEPWNLACDTLSDEYGWLVEGFDYKLLSKEEDEG